MALDPTTPFVWGAGGAPMTPQAAEAQRKVAQALMTQGMDYSPVRSPWQGAARVAQALVGGYESAQADASDRKVAEMQPQMLAAALSGVGSSPIASGAATPMGSTSIPSGEIDPRLSAAIGSAASASGIDPAYMTRLAMVENGGKVEGGSPLSSAQGPFQFLSGTAKQYGLANPNDPAASADAAARLTLDNKTALTNALGREPTPGELYLAHQQGAGGAIKLLQNPNAPVENVIGAEAARNNAATPGMTAGQFANKWMGKFGDIVQTVDPNQKNIIDAQADSPAPMAFAGTQAGAGAPTSEVAPIAPAAVPATPQPASSASMAKIAPLISLASSPYASAATKQIAGVLLSSQLSAIQKANDPMTALDMQSKTLAIRKAQQDLNDRKTVVVNGRLVDAQTGELVKDYSDIGKTPEGFKAIRNENGDVVAMQPLPGSEADTKNKSAQQKLDQQKDQQRRSADVVTQDIDRALNLTRNATLPVTGSIGSLTSNLPGTTSHDVSALLTGIKANISFDRLQAMRAASPTGGALGNVSDQEGARLASAYGNLEQSQSQAQFERNLKRVKNIYLDIVHGPGNGPPRETIDTDKPSAKPDRSAIEAEMKRRGLL